LEIEGAERRLETSLRETELLFGQSDSWLTLQGQRDRIDEPQGFGAGLLGRSNRGCAGDETRGAHEDQGSFGQTHCWNFTRGSKDRRRYTDSP
jgi:hypothetical protein